MALFLLLIIVAIALGIFGVVAKGLFYLLIIGVVVLIADLIFAGVRLRRSGRRPPAAAVLVVAPLVLPGLNRQDGPVGSGERRLDNGTRHGRRASTTLVSAAYTVISTPR
jgi:energy-coupling factor transporter transmembrane protein EcfT